MIKHLIFAILSLGIISCQERIYDLDLSKVEKVSYLDLPKEVSNFLSSNIDSIVNSQRDLFYSTDPDLEFTYGRGGVAKNWFGSINSNFHHFFIGGVHYRLKGNRGHPFILHKGYLYFCQLNLYKDNFKDETYYRIKIPSIR